VKIALPAHPAEPLQQNLSMPVLIAAQADTVGEGGPNVILVGKAPAHRTTTPVVLLATKEHIATRDLLLVVQVATQVNTLMGPHVILA